MSMKEKISSDNDVRLWIRLKPGKITELMHEEMWEFKTQSDFFMYILKKHYKLTWKR